MTFDIRVISLSDSPRRAAIREILGRHGVEFDFEDAFDARALDADACSAMTDVARVIARYGRPLSRGEVGCFVSHVRVWEKVVRSGRATIILEDDAMLDHAGKEIAPDAVPLAQCALRHIVQQGHVCHASNGISST